MKKVFYLKRPVFIFSAVFLILYIMQSCQPKSNMKQEDNGPSSTVVQLDWTKDAVIYELNVRQYSQDGTFNAVTADLDRLQSLGIEIIWLMPVHPIGKINRKGELGSYYSVKDYYAVNPEFGTMEDFKALVKAAHQRDIKVIIDWVPNHSSWDNPLITEHPEWYVKDEDGNMVSPFDWTDVVQFDYDQQGLRDYMTEVLKYWVTETGIDGFRFDVAHMIPVDYFNAMKDSLYQIKDVFLLAEADQPFLHTHAMNMSYDWRLHHIMNEVAAGNQDVMDIRNHFNYVDTAYPVNAILMEFTSNHDENSWNGTVYERLGDAAKEFAVFTFIIPGMPLIYNGQEACLDKRLEFFVKDPIEWKECDMTVLYKKLIHLKKTNKAIWSSQKEGYFGVIDTDQPEKLLVLERKNQDNRIIAVFNFSKDELEYDVSPLLKDGEYIDFNSGENFNMEEEPVLNFEAWGYRVFTR